MPSQGLPFPVDEYADRLRRVRERMAQERLDLLLVHTPENIYYLSGYDTPGYYAYQCIVVPLDRDPFIILRAFEEPNVRVSWLKDSVPYRDHEDPAALTVRTLKERGLDRGRIGVEKTSWFLTAAAYEVLKDGLPGELVDASAVVGSQRIVKSEREIALIRQAAKMADEAMAAAVRAIREGATENDVAAEVSRALILAGSEYQGLAPFIAAGTRSALPHATWQRRPIYAGEVVFLEFAGCVRRYHGALMRTALLPSHPAEYTAYCEAVSEGLNRAIETIRPGITAHEVDKACRSAIADRGFGEHFRHRTGYSIGIAYPPDWGEGHLLSIREKEQTVLQPNMVFHLVPLVIVEGQVGIGISETVLVTEDGCEPLTRFPREPIYIEKTGSPSA